MKSRRYPAALAALTIFAALGFRIPATAHAGESVKPAELVVFAAASLKETFGALATEFEAAHPGSHVALQFAGSQELRTQIENGAKADVFASADLRHMDALHTQKLVSEASIFARNEPVLIVPKANPAGLSRFEDLPKAKKLIVGVEEVPIGKYTGQILKKAAGELGDGFAKQVEANIASRELNVRQILAKVSLGEGDAGFVYRTDAATAADKAQVIEIPHNMNVIAEYPIATVTSGTSPDLARAWITLVLSEAGRTALSKAGFLTVSAPH